MDDIHPQDGFKNVFWLPDVRIYMNRKWKWHSADSEMPKDHEHFGTTLLHELFLTLKDRFTYFAIRTNDDGDQCALWDHNAKDSNLPKKSQDGIKWYDSSAWMGTTLFILEFCHSRMIL